MQEQIENECPICLQKLLYPVKLPCNHIFCFLCIKGIRKSPDAVKSCAMCRKPFNIEEIEQNVGIEKTSIDKQFNWFYQSKGSTSFWAFDERTNEELELAYSDEKDHLIISIAGFVYCIDFLRLIQYPVNHPERIRKIKRCDELNQESLTIKGIAGVRLTESGNDNSTSDINEEASGTNDDELSQILSESLQIEEVINRTN
ncbi:hypothetical protein ACKWTF_007904 [Chironomus riparius]